MSTTLATLRSEVKQALGNRADILNDSIDAQLNISQLALASRLRIAEIEKAVTFTLGVGFDIYGRPLDLWSNIIMVNTSNNRQEVKLRPLADVLASPSTPTGRPTKWCVRGTTTIFRPAPSTADVMEWTYKLRPPTMTDSVNLTLPDEFARAVSFDTIVHFMHINGEEDRAEIYRQHRNDSLASIGDARMDEVAMREDGIILVGPDQGVRLA